MLAKPLLLLVVLISTAQLFCMFLRHSSICSVFAFADNLFDPLISLSKKLGGGVETAAAGCSFAAGMSTAPLRSEIFAPTTKRRR
jgi:hypothetical protein